MNKIIFLLSTLLLFTACGTSLTNEETIKLRQQSIDACIKTDGVPVLDFHYPEIMQKCQFNPTTNEDD